jgi:hypothetical protein
MKKKGRIGSSFDDFLKQEGIYEEVTARAIKHVRSAIAPHFFAHRLKPDGLAPRNGASLPQVLISRCHTRESGHPVAPDLPWLLDRPVNPRIKSREGDDIEPGQ